MVDPFQKKDKNYIQTNKTWRYIIFLCANDNENDGRSMNVVRSKESVIGWQGRARIVLWS